MLTVNESTALATSVVGRIIGGRYMPSGAREKLIDAVAVMIRSFVNESSRDAKEWPAAQPVAIKRNTEKWTNPERVIK